MDINVKDSIIALDQALDGIDSDQYILYTCGGAALIFLGYEDRRTGDVDIIHHEIDKPLAKAIKMVAKKLKMDIGWLNNKVTPLGDRIGKNWKIKCIELYKGKRLTLKSISRQDLISSKLHAAVERRKKDYADLVWLKPTKSEIEIARKYTLKQSGVDAYEVFVNGYVRILKNELGI